MIAQANTLSHSEKQAVFSIASIFAVRLLGLFMIVPVFSLYAHTLAYSTSFLIGVALGCYGLTQALLQIPFGSWSDRYGRKPIIALGLGFFIVGSLCAALSHTIWGVIIGRSLQGAGAIGSATNALLADLTTEQNRIKAMAIVGAAIGVSFAVAMVLGPLLSSWLSVPDIFWISLLLGVAGVVILYKWTPASSNAPRPAAAIPIWRLVHSTALLPLNLGAFILHALLTATFVVLPIALQNTAGLPEKSQWQLYLPVLLLAFIAMVPFIIATSKKEQTSRIFLLAIAGLAGAECLLWKLSYSLTGIAIGLWLFFTAFTILEALLPSLVSKAAPGAQKGAALGVYSCCQFLGIFIGGSLGGWLYASFQISGALLASALLAAAWFIYALKR